MTGVGAVGDDLLACRRRYYDAVVPVDTDGAELDVGLRSDGPGLTAHATTTLKVVPMPLTKSR